MDASKCTFMTASRIAALVVTMAAAVAITGCAPASSSKSRPTGTPTATSADTVLADAFARTTSHPLAFDFHLAGMVHLTGLIDWSRQAERQVDAADGVEAIIIGTMRYNHRTGQRDEPWNTEDFTCYTHLSAQAKASMLQDGAGIVVAQFPMTVLGLVQSAQPAQLASQVPSATTGTSHLVVEMSSAAHEAPVPSRYFYAVSSSVKPDTYRLAVDLDASTHTIRRVDFAYEGFGSQQHAVLHLKPASPNASIEPPANASPPQGCR